jgi:hypothetical protein
MFDKASEIINLLNIMRLNDGRSELNVADYFDNDGNLTNSSGLAQACRGYISYAWRRPYDISDAVVAFGEYR